ncbi:MAG TPA: DNA repair protein RadC [Anaerolineaceae bacterium]|nr:DNA repair protein RadC [Anaerolineaceae bacterium]
MEEEQSSGYRIGDMPAKERPRERMEALGPKSLSEAELLAILLRVGIRGESAIQLAQRLLRDLNGVTGIYKTPFAVLCEQKGVGKAKASQILAALELGYRVKPENMDEKPLMNSPELVARMVEAELAGLAQENLWILLLNTRCKMIGLVKLYQGTINSSNVRMAEVFKEAVKKNAASIILVHNHPSGDPTPSTEDIVFTRSAIAAGQNLEIEVHDHLVIGGIGRYVSLREKGLAFR